MKRIEFEDRSGNRIIGTDSYFEVLSLIRFFRSLDAQADRKVVVVITDGEGMPERFPMKEVLR